MFESIVLTLSVNARDAMPDGGKLTWSAANIILAECVTTYKHAIPAGDYVAIEVVDTGCGIPANIVSRIFEPFISTRPGRGNGTGLMHVYCMLEQMNGRLLIESEIDKGTIVRSFIPRAD
jgi:two-component system cell cycle sensor histidine kinase/response regulator CckA